jgi:hypothetical protein
MEQNFVVLHDNIENPTSGHRPQKPAEPNVVTPRKTQRENADNEPGSKTPRKEVNKDKVKKSKE